GDVAGTNSENATVVVPEIAQIVDDFLERRQAGGYGSALANGIRQITLALTNSKAGFAGGEGRANENFIGIRQPFRKAIKEGIQTGVLVGFEHRAKFVVRIGTACRRNDFAHSRWVVGVVIYDRHISDGCNEFKAALDAKV